MQAEQRLRREGQEAETNAFPVAERPACEMPYDEKLLRWLARLSPAQRLEVALEADVFFREVRRDIHTRYSSRP